MASPETFRRFERAFDRFDHEDNRRRYDPRPGEDAYLHLVDLKRALRPRLEQARGEWLDFGAGRAPYARFMTQTRLRYADFPTDEGFGVGLDYRLEPGQPCPAPDSCFDGILSSQVLEHVDDPHAYLGDALRMLKPGGQLLLTTHGIWEDHPCPLDLYRWTQQGLAHDLSSVGFEVTECVPLTCGVRGLLQLLTFEMDKLSWRDRSISPTGRYFGVTGLLLGALRLYTRYRRQALHAYADRAFAADSIGHEGAQGIYTTLMITAVKPTA
ncbi:MAG: class I SAM-dependent methyltransferase [Solirubrobacteraceae bacterium]